MLIVVGMALFAIGVVLIAAAYAYHRDPAASPRLARWVDGETTGVVLTMVPASGLIALFYFVIDAEARNIGVAHLAIAAAIALAGWFAARSLFRRGTRLEQATIEMTQAAEERASAPGPAFASIPEKRAA